jgi:hypothetical protein
MLGVLEPFATSVILVRVSDRSVRTWFRGIFAHRIPILRARTHETDCPVARCCRGSRRFLRWRQPEQRNVDEVEFVECC